MFQLINSYLENRYQRVVLSNEFSHNKTSKWGLIKHGVPQGSILGPLLFLVYINDIPKITNFDNLMNNSITILFADEMSVIVTSPNVTELQRSLNQILVKINMWFNANLLSLNYSKTYYMQFQTRHQTSMAMNINNNNKLVQNTTKLKLLGYLIDSTMSWSQHIEMIIPKLNQACFVLRMVRSTLSLESLKMIYLTHFHSILIYGLVFWGNSACSVKVFRLQNRIIRIIMDHRPRASCRASFKTLHILPPASQYIYSIAVFMVNNKNLFKMNFEVHRFNTRNNANVFQPSTHLKICQNGPYHSGIKVFNSLPEIKNSSCNDQRFKLVLKKFLLTQSLYNWINILIIHL
jgi:hypothetical protein